MPETLLAGADEALEAGVRLKRRANRRAGVRHERGIDEDVLKLGHRIGSAR